ncbi:MAG: FKBP-type peptidyl-prolyl cis-trans isomerase [Gallionella sp.]|nr:FKBP-type peptidyl-prolyl cis-trans isomerase [Gallionella sp.]
MKRTLFLPLALLLTAGVFSITACSERSDTQKRSDVVAELVKTDIKPGEGTEAAAGHNVSVHYTGWLYNEAAPYHKGPKFDSSHDRNQPFEFQIGAGRVIKGWEQGVAGMKVGGQRTLVIPAYLGYGPIGAGEKIPPNAALVFEIELLAMR